MGLIGKCDSKRNAAETSADSIPSAPPSPQQKRIPTAPNPQASVLTQRKPVPARPAGMRPPGSPPARPAGMRPPGSPPARPAGMRPPGSPPARPAGMRSPGNPPARPVAMNTLAESNDTDVEELADFEDNLEPVLEPVSEIPSKALPSSPFAPSTAGDFGKETPAEDAKVAPFVEKEKPEASVKIDTSVKGGVDDSVRIPNVAPKKTFRIPTIFKDKLADLDTQTPLSEPAKPLAALRHVPSGEEKKEPSSVVFVQKNQDMRSVSMDLPEFTDRRDRRRIVDIPVDIEKREDNGDDRRSQRRSAAGLNTLSVINLRKNFGKKEIVRGVGFSMRGGEVAGLLGPNGAGKTTIFYMIVGFLKPTIGDIKLNNMSIIHGPMYKRARMGIAYLPQDASIFRKLTVEENIWSILESRRDINRKEKKDRLNQLIEDFNIGRIRKQLGYTLSGGERRRTEIARALAIEPKFLLLDEPFAGIDPIAVFEIKQIIKRLSGEGIGVLITDHNVRDTLEITTDAFIISQGVIVARGAKEKILENQTVRDVYLGSEFRM